MNQAKIYLLEGVSEPPNQQQTLASIAVLHDPTIAALSNFACLLWLQGESDNALHHALKAVELAQTINHPFSSAYANLFCAVIYQLRNDADNVMKHADAVWEIAERYNFIFWQAMAQMMKTWAREQQQSSATNIDRFVEAMKLYGSTGSRLTLSYYLAILADIKMRHGRFDDALVTLNDAIGHFEVSGEAFYLAEIYRLKALCLLKIQGQQSHAMSSVAMREIRDYFERAHQLASDQGAIALVELVNASRQGIDPKLDDATQQ